MPRLPMRPLNKALALLLSASLLLFPASAEEETAPEPEEPQPIIVVEEEPVPETTPVPEEPVTDENGEVIEPVETNPDGTPVTAKEQIGAGLKDNQKLQLMLGIGGGVLLVLAGLLVAVFLKKPKSTIKAMVKNSWNQALNPNRSDLPTALNTAARSQRDTEGRSDQGIMTTTSNKERIAGERKMATAVRKKSTANQEERSAMRQ